MSYTNDEYFNMLMCLGNCDCDYADARRDYDQRFATPRKIALPSVVEFKRLHIRMSTTGYVYPRDHIAEEQLSDEDDDDFKNQVQITIEKEPAHSMRSVACQSAVNHVNVFKKLKEPTIDFESRNEYSRWLLSKVIEDSEFLSRVLFTGECTFVARGGSTDKTDLVQPRWKINVWAGIIGDRIIGPHFLQNTISEENYLRFLREEVSEELDELSLDLWRRMWFQYDGESPYFSHSTRKYLNAEYGKRWIGSGGPVKWPSLSTDLTPVGSFLWDAVKLFVYKKVCITEDEQRLRIVEAFYDLKSDTSVLGRERANIISRCNKYCVKKEEDNFESY